jgi:gamma-glutamyltranspeptidase
MTLDHHSRRSLTDHLGWVLAVSVFISATSCTTQKTRFGHGEAAPLYASEARSDFGMVSSGSIEATRAGVAILEQGGNAIDAAITAALALGVSDPGGSGLGGMTYMLISFADGSAVAIDGSTPAPFATDSSGDFN